MFREQNLRLYPYNSLCRPSHSVFLLQHQHSSEPCESKQPASATLTAAQNGSECRAREKIGSQRGESIQEQPQQQPRHSAAWGEKSSPHHGDCGPTVRPQTVSGGTSGRGEHFH